MSNRTCLIVVDVQNDFLPGGALAVPEGDAILARLRDLVALDRFDRTVCTQDWHPRGHVSFASSHTGRAPSDRIELYGHEQVLWPDHCVPGTEGAALHASLPMENVDAIVRKGTDSDVDSYSGFRNNWNSRGERPPTGLAGYLGELGIGSIYVCGLARDVCVRWTAEDGADLGFDTAVIWDLTRSVDPAEDATVEQALAQRGIKLIDSGSFS